MIKKIHPRHLVFLAIFITFACVPPPIGAPGGPQPPVGAPGGPQPEVGEPGGPLAAPTLPAGEGGEDMAPPASPLAGELREPLAIDALPRFGSKRLTAPIGLFYFRDVVSGGDVNVAYIGKTINDSECVGFITPESSFRFVWSGSGNLRIFFVPDDGEGDTMLVVNDAYGNWYCNDDSFDSRHPAIDITDMAEGVYNIWVGSHYEDEEISGTLYFTTQDYNPSKLN